MKKYIFYVILLLSNISLMCANQFSVLGNDLGDILLRGYAAQAIGKIKLSQQIENQFERTIAKAKKSSLIKSLKHVPAHKRQKAVEDFGLAILEGIFGVQNKKGEIIALSDERKKKISKELGLNKHQLEQVDKYLKDLVPGLSFMPVMILGVLLQ